MKINFFVVLAVCVFLIIVMLSIGAILSVLGNGNIALWLYIISGVLFMFAVIATIVQFLKYKNKK